MSRLLLLARGHRALRFLGQERKNRAMIVFRVQPLAIQYLAASVRTTERYSTRSPGCHARNDLSRNEPHLHLQESQILAVIIVTWAVWAP